METEEITCTSCREKSATPNSYYCPSCRPQQQAAYKDWLARCWAGGPKVNLDGTVAFGLATPDLEHQGATFATINAKRPGLQQRVMPFLDREITSLALLGPAGTGKTWTAWATLFGYMVRNFDAVDQDGGKCVFVLFDDLYDAAHRTRAFGQEGRAANEELDNYLNAKILVIDQLGDMERMGDVEGCKIRGLLVKRQGSRKPTIITTNKSEQQLTAFLGSAFISRFGRGLIELNGQDLRR